MVTNPGKSAGYPLFLLLALLVACAVIYSPGLHGPLLLDDFPQLSPLMQDHAAGWRALLHDRLISNSGPLGRPVSMASFIFNAAVHGSDTWYWKATNLAIHLANGVLVFLLVRLLLQINPLPATPVRAGWLALLVAGVWLLHPLHVSTVLYTVQRMAQLATLFTLAGLLCYVIGRQRQVSHAGAGWWPVAVALLVFFPLAVLSKENGLLFPLLLALLELTVFRFRGDALTRRILAWLYLVMLLMPAGAGLVYLGVRFDALVLNGYELREFSFSARVLTQLRVLSFYLYQIFLPLPSNMGFYHDDFGISQSLTRPMTTLASLGLLSGLLLMAWFVRHRLPLVSLGIGVFFVAHLLESTIFPLEMVFEHRNYLASIGVLLALAGGLAALTVRLRVLAVVGVALLAFVTVQTAVRASIWGGYESLHNHMYAVHPDSRRLTVIFANSYADAGYYPRALALLDKFDGAGFRINRMYLGCLSDGRIADTVLVQETGALQGPVESHAMTGLIGIANLGLDEKCSFSADLYLGLLDKALTLPMRNLRAQKLLMYRAHYLHRTGDLDAAVAALEESSRRGEPTPVPLFLATEWLLDAGQPQRAQAKYAQARVVAGASGGDYSAFTVPLETRLNATGE